MRSDLDDIGMQRWLPWALRASAQGEALPDLRNAVRERLAGRSAAVMSSPSLRPGWRVVLAVAAVLVAMTVYWIAPERTGAKRLAAQPTAQDPVVVAPVRSPAAAPEPNTTEPAWTTVDDAAGIAALTDACTALRLRAWGEGGAAAVLRRVPKLTHLDLSLEANEQAVLEAADLRAIAALPSVRWLGLDGRTEIAAEWWAELAALPQLEVLHVPYVAVGDVGAAAIARLPSLRELELACDPSLTDAGLATLASVPGLRSLSLRHCGSLTAAGLAALGNLRQLERLDLSAVAGQAIGAMQRTSPAALRAVRERMQRQELNAARQRGGAVAGGVDDSVLASLAACARLRELRLECTAATAAGLAKLGKLPLQALTFTLTSVADAEALPPTVTELDTSSAADLDDAAMQALARQLPLLTSLTMQRCVRVSDEGLRAVLAAAALKRLDVRGCRALTAAILPQLLEERSLERLDVSGARWADDAVEAQLKALPAMRDFVNQRGGGMMKK